MTTMFDRPRLLGALREAGCAALVVRDPCFWTYLAGFALPGTLARHLDWIAGPRPNFAILTDTGSLVLLVDTIARDLCLARTTAEVVGYEVYRDDPFETLNGLVRERCGDAAIVAVDRPAAWLWAEAGGTLPFRHRRFDETMWRIMARKTPGEIARLRLACGHLDDAFAALAADPPDRWTEAALHARIVGWCLDRGSQFTHGILNVERNGVLYAGESQLEVREGDMVRTDYVAYFDGYPGHQSRMLVRGAPSAVQRDTYARLLDVHRTVIAACRPGRTGGDVHALVAQEFARHGMSYTGKISGHGVGPWMHQQYPMIAAGSTDPIEPGMTIAIEPYSGSWHLQDIVLVGKDANTILSDRLDIGQPLVI